MHSRTLMIMTAAFLMSGCETYNECVRQAMSIAEGKDETKRLEKMCVLEHERPLSNKEKREIEIRGTLGKLLDSGDDFYMSTWIENDNRNVKLTRLKIRYQNNAAGKSFTHEETVAIEPEGFMRFNWRKSDMILPGEEEGDVAPGAIMITGGLGVDMR